MPDPNSAPTSYEELAHVIEILPDLIREKRRRERLSIREVGKRLGISFSTISRLEARKGDLRTDNLLVLLRWIGELPRGGGDA